MASAVYVCGGDLRPAPRDACPNDLHDWPLPAGYVDAAIMAGSRLSRRWANTCCPDCGLYGWRPGRINDDDTKVASTEAEGQNNVE
jgi:hypothetical protein